MHKIFLSLILLHSLVSAMQPAQIMRNTQKAIAVEKIAAVHSHKDAQEAALQDFDKNQKLAYYLNTLSKVENLTCKVLQLLDQGADVNRRISTRDEAIKMVLQEEGWTSEEIADLASDAKLESWTPLMAIAQRDFKPISGLDQRLITNRLLHKGAQVNATYRSNGRPEMNDMTARAFAYQSKEFKDFTEPLFDFEYQQWLKEVAQRS